MARVETGGIFLEIQGASEEQVRRGLAAALLSLESACVDIREAFAAQARADEAGLTELDWEQGLIEKPVEASEADRELSEVVDEAWIAAIRTSGFDPGEDLLTGKFGVLAH